MLRSRRLGLGCHEGEVVAGAGAWLGRVDRSCLETMWAFQTMDDDHPCVPAVNDGKFRADLFVTTCPCCNSPGQTRVTKNPASRRETFVGRSRTRDKTLAVRGPCGVARVRSRSWNARHMVRRGRDDTSAKRTKDLEAHGRFITKEFEKGLSGNGGTRVGLMIEGAFGATAAS